MADDFLNNDNYCNKGGLNGKPKATRPEPPKGQLGSKKEIIINGIEVSECFKYTKGFEEFDCGENHSKFHYRFCSENQNCYFKQFKRKEQECEAQRYKLNYYIEKTTQLLDDIDNYKQALYEIEENIKAMNNECFYDDICECNNCDMKNGCTYYRKSNILNIINKANDCK